MLCSFNYISLLEQKGRPALIKVALDSYLLREVGRAESDTTDNHVYYHYHYYYYYWHHIIIK